MRDMFKTCPCCLIEKDLGSFSYDQTRKDGINRWCRQCVKERNALPDYADIMKNSWYRHRSKHPDRYKAYEAVNYALRKGVLIKAHSCEMCDANGRLEFHHESYQRERWLVGIWLCVKCHQYIHRTRKADKRS